MRTIKSFFLLFFLTFFAFDSFSQDDKAYVIQLATFGSWEDFAKNEKAFYTNTGTADNNIYAEKVGNMIKVYLFDSYQGGVSSFYAGEHLDKVLKEVRSNPHFPDAFRKPEANTGKLTPYGDVFEQYKNKELTAKGGTVTGGSSSGKYKIQLGAFKEQKSNDYIADNYGLSETEKDNADQLLSYDFTTVGKVVCRRYYFGEYTNKRTAWTKMKALEKKSKKKLILVEQ